MGIEAPLLGTYLALGAQALIPITLGSFKSLKTPASTTARRRRAKVATLGEEDEEEEEELEETLTMADSILFPVLGSVALLGLWALLKYVGKKWIDLFLGLYFTGAGMFAFQTTFGSVLKFLLNVFSVSTPTYHFRISSGIKQTFHLPISLSSLVLLPFSIIVPALYIPLDRPYVLSNVLALCLATAALALLRLDGFPTAFLLLALLLVYDIFWVFATPVMVTVAKGIDAPIKILAPKSGGAIGDFAMLGLGDIVVPGLVIALCLRFDLARHALDHPARDVTTKSPFGKAYFYTSIVCYIVGLATTIVVMHTTRHAQPALLYLSPACILGPTLLAVARGELGLLWKWSDAPEEVKVVDETIEAASEVVMRARAEAKAKAAAAEAAAEAGVGAQEDSAETFGEPTAAAPVDDSWMDGGGVVVPDTDGKARKRKSNKKK